MKRRKVLTITSASLGTAGCLFRRDGQTQTETTSPPPREDTSTPPKTTTEADEGVPGAPHHFADATDDLAGTWLHHRVDAAGSAHSTHATDLFGEQTPLWSVSSLFSACLLDGETFVHTESTDGGRLLVERDLSDGSVNWWEDVSGGGIGGLVSVDEQVVVNAYGSVTGFDRVDGTTRWSVDIERGSPQPPIHTEQGVLVTHGEFLDSPSTATLVDPTAGEIVWERILEGDGLTAPVADGDRAFVGSSEGMVYDLRLADGTVSTATDVADAAVADLCLVARTLLVRTETGTVYAYLVDGWHERWARSKSVGTTPAVTGHGDRAFVPTEDGVHELDVEDGTDSWIVDVGAACGPVSTTEDVAVFGTAAEHRRVYVFHRDGETERSSVWLPPRSDHHHPMRVQRAPILGEGTFVVAAGNKLVCLEVT